MSKTRTKDGKFLPGVSGNPNGRPKSETTELRRQLSAHGAEVAEVVVRLALDGDMTAARLVLERLAPALKPTAESVTVDIGQDATPADAGRAIVAAAASGQMPADVAATLMRVLGDLSKLIEAGELQGRVERLEELLNEQND